MVEGKEDWGTVFTGAVGSDQGSGVGVEPYGQNYKR